MCTLGEKQKIVNNSQRTRYVYPLNFPRTQNLFQCLKNGCYKSPLRDENHETFSILILSVIWMILYSYSRCAYMNIVTIEFKLDIYSNIICLKILYLFKYFEKSRSLELFFEFNFFSFFSVEIIIFDKNK